MEPKVKRLSDRVYQQLKDMIIGLDLSPGQPLVERELTERFQVGHMPLRDALQRLAVEELVTIVPRQGTFVADVSVGDLRSILELRLLLEPYCARLAARRAMPDEVRSLQRHLEAQATKVGRESPYTFAMAFHRLLSAVAHNPRLARSLETLQAHNLRFFLFLQLEWPDPQKMFEQHQQIVSAVERRAEEEAGALMTAHVQEACRLLLAAWTPDSIDAR